MSTPCEVPSGVKLGKLYRVGSLVYGPRALMTVMFWMLLGDLCLQIMEQLPTSLVPLQLRWAQASELAAHLEKNHLLTEDKVKMVIAGNHPSLISGLPEKVQVIDLDFSELIHTALDRLLYRAKHLPSHTLTFLVPPRLSIQKPIKES